MRSEWDDRDDIDCCLDLAAEDFDLADDEAMTFSCCHITILMKN